MNATSESVGEVMLDLETLSLAPNACILSIGACRFNPRSLTRPTTRGQFEVFIDPESCVQAGLNIDAGTVMWWMADRQAEARSALMAAQPRLPLRQALEAFSVWYGPQSIPLWGNGANFDNVVLRSAFDAVGLPAPWKFWDDRCFRTVRALAPDVQVPRQGIKHSALADALSQAACLQAVFNRLKLTC